MKTVEKQWLSGARSVISAASRRAIKLTDQTPLLRMLLRGPLSYSIVCDEMSFKALQGEWEELFARAAVQLPFLRYSWVQLCWNCERNSRKASPFIVVVRKYGRPVLIAPLVREERTLSFLDSSSPQYNDVLVEESVTIPVHVDYFWKTLCGMRSVRSLESAWMRSDSPLAKHLATARQVSEGPRWRAPFLDLGKFGDWETYLQNLSRSVRQNHRKQLRRLEKLGAVEFRMADASSCSSDMAWLFAQKRQWAERTGKSSRWLRAPATEQLFTTAARAGIESGRTWLAVLWIDGATIATSLNFREGSTLYASKMAHDPVWDRYSPGRTLALLMIERAFQEGLREIDFGLGAHKWKIWLSTGIRRVRSRKVQLNHLAA